MAVIGIIEDDRLLNDALAIVLKKEGYETRSAYTWEGGRLLGRQEAELLLIDINLPDGDGVSLCSRIREEREVPVIFLTARDEEKDMLGAFNAGADDYVVKPFKMQVLLKRIQAVLRRSVEEKEEFIYQKLKVSFAKQKVSYDGNEILLTPKEYQLLEYMIRNKGQVLTRENILERIWDLDGLFVGENTVSVTVNRLRRKIEPDPSRPVFIKTLFGVGYIFGE